VLQHELVHFSQSFFTLAGLSRFEVVRLMHTAFGELLNELVGTVRIPILEWFRSDGCAQHTPTTMKWFDRIRRLSVQLESSAESYVSITRLASRLAGFPVGEALAAGAFRLDDDQRAFMLGTYPLMPIDYAAICESMAFACQLVHVAWEAGRGIDAEHQLGAKLDAYEKAMVPELDTALRDGRLLQYTFPLLLLTQSGYAPFDAVPLSIECAFIALMAGGFDRPAIPEAGMLEVVEFGTQTTDAYMALLKFLCSAGAAEQVREVRAGCDSAIAYLDGLCGAAGIRGFRMSFEEAPAIAESLIRMTSGESDGERWYAQLLRAASSYWRFLLDRPYGDAMRAIQNPVIHLLGQGIAPVIMTPKGFLRFGMIAPDDQLVWQSVALRLQANKYLMLGADAPWLALNSAFGRDLREFAIGDFNFTVENW
jgi:hypothetical protein